MCNAIITRLKLLVKDGCVALSDEALKVRYFPATIWLVREVISVVWFGTETADSCPCQNEEGVQLRFVLKDPEILLQQGRSVVVCITERRSSRIKRSVTYGMEVVA